MHILLEGVHLSLDIMDDPSIMMFLPQANLPVSLDMGQHAIFK